MPYVTRTDASFLLLLLLCVPDSDRIDDRECRFANRRQSISNQDSTLCLSIGSAMFAVFNGLIAFFAITKSLQVAAKREPARKMMVGKGELELGGFASNCFRDDARSQCQCRPNNFNFHARHLPQA